MSLFSVMYPHARNLFLRQEAGPHCSAQHLSPHLKLLPVCAELGGRSGELFWLCPCSSQGPTPIRIWSRRTLKQGGSRGRCESTKRMCSPTRCLEKTSGRSEDRGWTRAVPPLPHFQEMPLSVTGSLRAESPPWTPSSLPLFQSWAQLFAHKTIREINKMWLDGQREGKEPPWKEIPQQPRVALMARSFQKTSCSDQGMTVQGLVPTGGAGGQPTTSWTWPFLIAQGPGIPSASHVPIPPPQEAPWSWWRGEETLLLVVYSVKDFPGAGWEEWQYYPRCGHPFYISLGCTFLFPPTDNWKSAIFFTATQVKWKILPPSSPGCLPGEEVQGRC